MTRVDVNNISELPAVLTQLGNNVQRASDRSELVLRNLAHVAFHAGNVEAFVVKLHMALSNYYSAYTYSNFDPSVFELP